jgi:hypothetical protein
MKQLVLLDDLSQTKKDIKINNSSLRVKEGQREDGIMYNPLVHVELSNMKKHNSLVPLKDSMKNDKNDYNEYRRIESQELNNNNEMFTIRVKKREDSIKKLPRSATLASNKAEDPLMKSMLKKSLEEKTAPRSKYKIWLAKVIDSPYTMAFMTMLTIFALFASDIQIAWLTPIVDDPFDIVQTCLFCIFSLEIILTCLCKEEYLCSFFFWLDIIATLSLLQDISFIFDPILAIGNVTTTSGIASTSQKKATASISKITAASR